MATSRDELNICDLVSGEPLECLECGCYMKLSRSLIKNVGRRSKVRRIRFKCEVCGFEEVIHADGQFDVKPFLMEGKKSEKQEKESRNLI